MGGRGATVTHMAPIPLFKYCQMVSKIFKLNHNIYLEGLVCLKLEIGGGWPDQTRRDDSRCSPSILQASWDVWDTWNSLLDISREVGNTKNTTFYHFIDQKCGDSGEEKWITVQACQSILQCSRGK